MLEVMHIGQTPNRKKNMRVCFQKDAFFRSSMGIIGQDLPRASVLALLRNDIIEIVSMFLCFQDW